MGGEKFAKGFKLDDIYEISIAAEKLTLGWPEATKWNWAGKQGHAGERKQLTVAESIKEAQHYAKYFSKKAQEQQEDSFLYEDIENEARQYNLHEEDSTGKLKDNILTFDQNDDKTHQILANKLRSVNDINTKKRENKKG